jgi:hypothetical protein
MADNFLDHLSAVVAQRLGADSFYSDITIKEERKGVIVNDVQAALGVTGLLPKAGKIGAAVIVRAATPERVEGEATGFLQVSLELEIAENPQVNSQANGTGKTAAQIWAYTYRLLNGYHDQNLNQTLTAEERPAVTQHADGVQLYVLRMRCLYPLAYIEKCNIGAAGTGGLLELEQVSGNTFRVRATTTTSGALIHYAVSALADAPVLPTASSASAASNAWYQFTVTTDSRVIAVAYASGKLASDSLVSNDIEAV